MRLVNKYAGPYHTSVTITNDGPSLSEKGYYAMFILRDDTLQSGERLKVASLGKSINIKDLVAAFSNLVDDIMSDKNKVDYV